MVEHHEWNGISYTIYTDEVKSIVYIFTNLQSFRVDMINPNGGMTVRKIIRKVRNNEIKDINDIIGNCGRSVQLTAIRRAYAHS